MSSGYYVYVGTYTHPILFGTGQILEGKGEGIYLFRMDPETGKLTRQETTTGVVNPSYLTLDPARRHLYAVNELKTFGGMASGAVSAFRVEPETGRLTFLNQKATGGTDPCHVVVNDRSTQVLVSNFMSGSVCVFPIQPDGALGDASQFIQHSGSSVHPKRQSGPHAHSLIFDKSNRFAFVPDLGMDKLMVYKTDFDKGRLSPADVPYVSVQPGAGPRHCVFHPSGRYCYLIQELDSTLSAYRYNQDDGTFELLQTVPTVVSDGFTGDNTCADVQILPNGRFVYGSNRGHDSIVIYRIDQETGRLSFVGMESTRGRTPRNFAIDPSGRFLLAANQDSDNIVVFKIEPATGTLSEVDQVAVPTPVCVRVYEGLSAT